MDREKNHQGSNFYLNTKGKFKAQALLASINRSIGYFIDNFGERIESSKGKFTLIPFKQKKSINEIRRSKDDMDIQEKKRDTDINIKSSSDNWTSYNILCSATIAEKKSKNYSSSALA